MGAGANKNLRFTDFSRAFYELLPVMRDASKNIDDLTNKIKGFGTTGKMSIGDIIHVTSTFGPALLQLGKSFDLLGNKSVGAGFSGMGVVLNNISSSLGNVNKQWDDSAGEIETVSHVIKMMNEELAAAKKDAEIYKYWGKPFDLATKEGEIFIQFLGKLMKQPYNLDINSEPIKNIIKLAKDLGANFYADEKNASSLSKTLLNLNAQFKFIDMMDKLSKGGTLFKFDANAEKLQATRTTLDAFIKDTEKVKDLNQVFNFSLTSAGIAVPISYKMILDGLVKSMNQFGDAEIRVKDDVMLRYLQSQADDFGGLDNQIKLVNYELNKEQRRLEDLLNAPTANIDAIKKQEDVVNGMTKKYDELTDKKRLIYFRDMNDAFKTSTSYSNLLSAEIENLTKDMELMSAKGQGGTKEFQDMANQITRLTDRQKAVDGMASSFTDLFTNVMNGGESASKSIKDFGNAVLQVFERIIAEKLGAKLANSLFPTGGGGGSSMGWGALNPGGVGTGAGAGVNGGDLMQLLPYLLPMLAGGGTIPPGYPNDTYPALLSSGETVMPKGLKNSMSIEFEPIELKIKDNTLTAFLKKADKKNNLY
jgi:archaellum component FlaC